MPPMPPPEIAAPFRQIRRCRHIRHSGKKAPPSATPPPAMPPSLLRLLPFRRFDYASASPLRHFVLPDDISRKRSRCRAPRRQPALSSTRYAEATAPPPPCGAVACLFRFPPIITPFFVDVSPHYRHATLAATTATPSRLVYLRQFFCCHCFRCAFCCCRR